MFNFQMSKNTNYSHSFNKLGLYVILGLLVLTIGGGLLVLNQKSVSYRGAYNPIQKLQQIK
jgi:hypothetical protein